MGDLGVISWMTDSWRNSLWAEIHEPHSSVDHRYNSRLGEQGPAQKVLNTPFNRHPPQAPPSPKRQKAGTQTGISPMMFAGKASPVLGKSRTSLTRVRPGSGGRFLGDATSSDGAPWKGPVSRRRGCCKKVELQGAGPWLVFFQ